MKRKNRQIAIVAAIIFSVATVAAIGFGIFVFTVYTGISFEADERMFDGARGFSSTTFYANAAEDGDEYIPIAIDIGGEMRKVFYSLDEISPYLKEGIVAVEDKKFYDHGGIDIKRTVLATANYIFGRDRIFGASTITQQVIKNISGDNKISVKRKLQEIIRAIHIERNYSKEEILEVYLNVIPMSENIYGVGAASKAYFGKEPSELSAQEAATLIGITNAPTAYNPHINPDACKRKRNIVLSVMRDDGIITAEEYEKISAQPLGVMNKQDIDDRVDSWFIETVIDDVVSDMVAAEGMSPSAARMTLLGGGYSVYTTMKPSVQKLLEDYFENISNFPREVENGLNYAMTVTDSQTGYLVGIIGRVGKKQGNRLLNHATVPHVPGSTLKPIALYAPLIDEGKINWSTVFDDVPVSFSEQNGEYREYPKNSPAVYDGLITVKDAICKSKNTVAVRLANIRTPKKIYNSLIKDFGFTTLVSNENGIGDISIAPMALGQLTYGVSLRKMGEAYSAFVGDGEWKEACSYLYLTDYKGRVVIEKEQLRKQIYKETTAEIMNRLLMTVTASGTASKISLKNQINTAGKTGTSGGNRDKSFIGYTPYYTAGIWCGYDDSRAIGSLAKSHIEIWDEVMSGLHKDIIAGGVIREFSTAGISYLPYCKDSGKIYTDTCRFDPRGDRRDYGYFTDADAPREMCDRHVMCKFDSVTKSIACEKCPEENIVNVALISVGDRSFPKEITVTDAEYVYRDIDGYTKRPDDPSLPYFQYAIPDGVFVGKSKGKKQFNSNCSSHNK